MSTQVPASALLHTALAIRSPSFKALDILSSRLPPEIRREIHFALLSSVTISLAAASTAALKDYERRLKASLCRDCREYNETIYGADVWKWDGYRGACLCRAQQAVWRRAQRCTPWDLLKNVFVKEAVPTQVSRRVIQQEDVQLFASRDAWLVDHLSRHTLCRGFSSVWEAVDLALRPYGCCVSSDMSKTLEVTSDSIQDSGSDEWAAQCALKRAVDGLMLSEELPFGEAVSSTLYGDSTAARSAIAARKALALAPTNVVVGSPRMAGGLHTSTIIPIPYMVACGRTILFLLAFVLFALFAALSAVVCA